MSSTSNSLDRVSIAMLVADVSDLYFYAKITEEDKVLVSPEGAAGEISITYSVVISQSFKSTGEPNQTLSSIKIQAESDTQLAIQATTKFHQAIRPIVPSLVSDYELMELIQHKIYHKNPRCQPLAPTLLETDPNLNKFDLSHYDLFLFNDAEFHDNSGSSQRFLVRFWYDLDADRYMAAHPALDSFLGSKTLSQSHPFHKAIPSFMSGLEDAFFDACGVLQPSQCLGFVIDLVLELYPEDDRVACWIVGAHGDSRVWPSDKVHVRGTRPQRAAQLSKLAKRVDEDIKSLFTLCGFSTIVEVVAPTLIEKGTVDWLMVRAQFNSDQEAFERAINSGGNYAPKIKLGVIGEDPVGPSPRHLYWKGPKVTILG